MSDRIEATAHPLWGPSRRPSHESPADLAARARTGTRAMLGTRVLSILVTLVSITVYARLISPAHYGVWALATVPLGVATFFLLGLASSIVQAGQLTSAQRDAYFWTCIAMALAAAAVLALAAPLLARLYDAPGLPPVLWAGCISLALTGTGVTHAALLRRELRYGKLAIVEGGGMVCGLIAGLAGAYLWRNVWALVAAHIASAAWMSSAAWLLSGWAPPVPSRTPAKVNLRFGLQLASYNVLSYAASNAWLAAGFRLSGAELGFFNRAHQLCVVGYFSFLKSTADVGCSLLCRLDAARAYADAYIWLARRVTVVFLPGAALLPIVSSDLILTLLGPAWAPASPIVAWLTPALLGGVLVSLCAQLMTSQGRGDELRRWALADLLLRGAGAAAGSPFGVAGLAAGFSLATFFLSAPLMVWLAARSGPVRLRDQFTALWPGWLLAAGATLAALLSAEAADAFRLGAGWGRLLFVAGDAVLAWGLMCLVLRPAREALLGKGMVRE